MGWRPGKEMGGWLYMWSEHICGGSGVSSGEGYETVVERRETAVVGDTRRRLGLWEGIWLWEMEWEVE